MCVGGDDGTVCRAGRCTAERKEEESNVWVRGGETDNRNLSRDTSVHCERKQLPNGLLSFGPFYIIIGRCAKTYACLMAHSQQLLSLTVLF